MMKPFRLDKRRSRVMGVCASLADSTGVDLLLVRIATVLLVIALPGIWGIVAYCAAGFCAPARTS